MATLDELLGQLEDLAALDDEALNDLADELTALVDALTEGNPDDQALADAERAAEGIDTIRTEIADRETAASERAERAQALRDRVRGEVEEESAEGDDGEPEHVPADEVEVIEEEGEPIAASGTRTPARTARVGRVTPRRFVPPPQPDPVDVMSFPEWGLTAAANAPGVPAGQTITDYDQLASLFANAFRLVTGPGAMGPRAQVPLARAGRGGLAEYGEQRFLDGHAASNMRKIQAVTHPRAITASGGFCAPINISYDMPVLGSSARPVRDTAMARFGADRGGVRTLDSPVLADVTGAVGVWTQQNDIDAAGNDGTAGDVVKPCLTIDCPGESESLVQAITECFRVGNFRQRFFPEQIEAVMRLIAVAAARVAEIELLKVIKANSTAVTTARLLGTTRDLLPYLDQAMAAFRDRWRLEDTERLRWVAPRWLRDEMRADIARSLPGDPAVNFVVADSDISTWLSARNVNVTWALDGTTASQHFGAQGAGALVKFPTAAETFLYPEGAFLFLDGGSLDLGLIRDSQLALTNDLMFFSENTEGAHFMGPESLMLTMTLCPDGTVSGTADIDPCA